MFSCRCETYPIDFIYFQKHCVVKVIRYENCTELFVSNGKKKPIRYEFHNGMKPNRYNENKGYISNRKTIASENHCKSCIPLNPTSKSLTNFQEKKVSEAIHKDKMPKLR